MKNEKLFYLYVVLGFLLNIFVFPTGGLNILRSALTALTDLDNNVEVKKVVIESDGYADKSPGSWHMEKSAEWTSTTNAKIVFDVDTNPSFHSVPSLDVIMVLDVSGSMSGTKMDKLKDSAKKYVNDVLSLDEDNTIALVKYESDASVVTPFVNDADTLITYIDGLEASGNTNYYAGLKKVEELLTDYKTSKDRGLVVLFMTDGAANEDTSMIKSQYEYLKEKYHDMLIVGIQYEMGSKITEYLKQASDIQYDAYMGDIYDNFFTATFSGLLDYYEKFEIVDYINNDYFEVIRKDDIKVSMGTVRLETNESSQKVIWTVEPNTLLTKDSLHMEINAKLKKEYQDKVDYYPTNKGVEVTTKLPDEEEKYTESDKTPILRYGYVIYYDGNYPSECKMTYNTEEYHYFHEVVELADVPPVCEGYQFTGWKIKGVTEKVSDTSFNMPERDVYIKGTWGKTELAKSTEGTVYIAPPPTLYNAMKYQAVPDNVRSAYVTSSSGIDFKKVSSNSNGKGVYMIADTAGDEYPIYYYRGAVDNNNVLFAGICWKMIRTTETGGVKLIYNGKPTTDQDGKKICNRTGSSTQVTTYNYNSSNDDSPSYANYKYGLVYEARSKSPANTNILFSRSLSSNNYYFSSTISYENGTYKLGEDATQYPWKDNYNILNGYYTCFSETNTTCSTSYYILGGTSSTGYYLILKNGTYLDDVNTSIVLGQSVQDNGNDTYTLKDTMTIKISDWYPNYSTYKNYYACQNDLTSDTCSVTDMSYIVSAYDTGFYGSNVIKYGKSFTYDVSSKMYTLTDTIESFAPSLISSDLATHHYTCLNNTDTCTKINYMYYLSGNSIDYITISGGRSVEEALDGMFSNTNDSNIKKYIENTWYASNMVKYENYLEDTVWCDDRSYEDSKVNSGWNPNGGDLSKILMFDTYYRESNGIPSLMCREQDSLTVANGGVNKPVGLITVDEAIYAGGGDTNKSYYLYTGEDYWTLSPHSFTSYTARIYYVSSSGYLIFSQVYYWSSFGIRPVISLKSGITYSDGDGTKENPYVVVTE